jgi:hypothetical protein
MRKTNRRGNEPVSVGKFCDYCTCTDCQGETRSYVGTCTLRMIDDTHMCDLCYTYPDCFADGENCEHYCTHGWCEHRPTPRVTPVVPEHWVPRDSYDDPTYVHGKS